MREGTTNMPIKSLILQFLELEGGGAPGPHSRASAVAEKSPKSPSISPEAAGSILLPLEKSSSMPWSILLPLEKSSSVPWSTLLPLEKSSSVPWSILRGVTPEFNFFVLAPLLRILGVGDPMGEVMSEVQQGRLQPLRF
jgi:hypothetical protein